jgi:hypothetical protein
MKDDTRSYGSGEKSGNVIAEYLYDNENGERYHKVERTDTKQFPQYHWVKGKNGMGHWVKGAPKGDKVPYFLKELIATPLDTPIFICEGEKDAETVFDLGLPATTAPGGAGKWPKSMNKWFEGRITVFILEDNDKFGRKHVRVVTDALHDIVKNIRVITFRDLPYKGDVTDWVKEHGGTKEKLLARAAKARSRKKIDIHYDAEAFGAVVDQIQHALFETGQEVFQRAGKLVQPIWTELPTHLKGHKTKTTLLQPFQMSNMRYMVSKHTANIQKQKLVKPKDGGAAELKWVTVIPPKELIDSLLTLGHWVFPVIAGVVNTPTMRPNGTILEPGYDEETQLWYEQDDGFEMPAIKDRPTKDDAVVALDKLKGLIDETPFVNEEDWSVALSAILTVVGRGAFKVCPMFLFQAPMAGTGKSYLVNLISHIGFGQPCPVITLESRVEEMQKKIGALVLEGAPIVSLDNCSDDIGSDLLCQLVEQPIVKIRILGQSSTPSCAWRGVLFATGNNITVIGDMARRTLICTLDRKDEQPEFYHYQKDPIEMVMSNRGEYVAAALTIMRAYLYSKDKIRCKPVASYNDWSRFAREPLIWLGLHDPVEGMDKARNNDPRRSLIRQFYEEWENGMRTINNKDGSTSKIKLIEQKSKIHNIALPANETKLQEGGFETRDRIPAFPDLYYPLMELGVGISGKVDPRKLGKLLSSLRGQIHGPYKLEIAKEDNHNGHLWELIRLEGKK